MTDSLLQVRNLTIHFCSPSTVETRAVDNVSFDVAPGETVGFLGESGCGKTTLALSLLRLLPQAARVVSGSVRILGQEMLLANAYQLQKVRGAEASIIFQEPGMSLNPVMRVGHQVAEVVRAHTGLNRRRCKEEAQSVLAQVRLSDTDIYFAYPHQLSGGERQRVVIAQALSCKPSLLIADEPTSALDNTIQAEILALLKELKNRLQIALLFITHNPAVLAGLADRVFVMYAGRIVEEGTLEQVYWQSRHPYTQALLKSIPPMPGNNSSAQKMPLPALGSIPPDLGYTARGCPFQPRCPDRMDTCATRDPPELLTNIGSRVRCIRYES